MMKFACSDSGGVRTVDIRGDIDGAGCDCLDAFRRKDVAGNVRRFVFELGQADFDDGAAVAVMVDWIRSALERAEVVEVRQAPQMLAHTLYKVGMLNDERLRLVEPRQEEPYG